MNTKVGMMFHVYITAYCICTFLFSYTKLCPPRIILTSGTFSASLTSLSVLM